MKRPLMVALLLVLALCPLAQAQDPTLPDVQRALARPTPLPQELQPWLEALGYEVSGEPGEVTASLERGDDPEVVLWIEDGPEARLTLAAMRHLGRHWKGTLRARLGKGERPVTPPPDLLLRARRAASLTEPQICIPRADYRAHVDLITIEVPATPQQDCGVACAEILLALRTEMEDPLGDTVLQVEKFQASPHGRLVVSLKTYDLEARRHFLDLLAALVKKAAPQASLDIPPEPPGRRGPNWSNRLRQALGKELGAERVLAEPPLEEDNRYLEAGVTWGCPAVSLWWGSLEPRQTAQALVTTLLEAFRTKP